MNQGNCAKCGLYGSHIYSFSLSGEQGLHKYPLCADCHQFGGSTAEAAYHLSQLAADMAKRTAHIQRLTEFSVSGSRFKQPFGALSHNAIFYKTPTSTLACCRRSNVTADMLGFPDSIFGIFPSEDVWVEKAVG